MIARSNRSLVRTTVFVAAVVAKGDEILFVRQSAGHPLGGQWTVPWGRVELGESPMTAALRETQEEGGIRARIEGLLGVQELPSPQAGCVALVYLCKHVSGEPAPSDTETDAARYYSPADLKTIKEPLEPWSAWLAHRVFAGSITVTYADSTSPILPDRAFL